jgi:predicted dienelactone hydrolase
MRRILLLSVLSVSSAANFLFAQQVAFLPHDINPAAEFPACGVMDVDHDGKLDIVSGGFWYEAPKWTKHFLREVEVIRGRFDDYSNLEMDVNNDGWTDIISVNYRSASIFWIEHPGEVIKTNPETPWTKHLVDNPGPMETGRLYDIDGDGRLDILPNGTTFAAWYELAPPTLARSASEGNVGATAGSPSSAPRFIRHDLPLEIAGHGVGFGDINGDGRGDIVGPHGWLEAPQDRRSGRWIYHQDWDLTKDASIPILVHDVDGDGDNDLIWGRGHRYGLYWLENGGSLLARSASEGPTLARSASEGNVGATAQRSWTWRAIDTSWAQPHSIFLADLDGDKKPELVAGKRYMGHEGKDPGEYDLLCAYYYKFDPKIKTWSRHEIYFNHRAAFGLDPRAVDIDNDGDLDLVAADRSSLVLLENRRPQAVSGSFAKISYSDDYHQNPLLVGNLLWFVERGKDRIIPIRAATSPSEYAIRRENIKILMQHNVMGNVPDSTRRIPLDIQIESREETPDYARIKLTYAAEPDDRVPALLLVPKKVTLNSTGLGGGIAGRDKTATTGRGFGGRLPAMLCLHPTNPDGKAQTAGLVGTESRHYGHQLAKRGFVCLIPDYPSFGDYKSYDFKQNDPSTNQPHYVSGSMKAIWNNIRAVDLLESLGYVDIDNIGVIGHSLGGHNALFTAVFEPRLKAVVTSCGFTAFHNYMKGDLKGWTSDRYMPKIRDVYENNPDKMPFDFPEVLAAIAPRGIYVNAPLHDSNFDVDGVKKCITAAQPVFDLLGAKDQLVVEYPDAAHDFPDDVRERVYKWLQKQLK